MSSHFFWFKSLHTIVNRTVIHVTEIYSILDFVPKEVSPEALENTPEDSVTTEKLKSGVHSYLKQNAEKVRLFDRHILVF